MCLLARRRLRAQRANLLGLDDGTDIAIIDSPGATSELLSASFQQCSPPSLVGS
jgi:hypothetical protein